MAYHSVCIVSIVRVVELSRLSSSADPSCMLLHPYVLCQFVSFLTQNLDAYATTIIWSTVEVGVGIFCACLPVMRPIFNFLYPVITRSSSDSKGLPRHHQPRSRRDTLRMKSYRSSDVLEDRAPFAQVETSVIRNSQSDDREGQELAGNAITVTTSINQNIMEMLGDQR